MSPKLTQQAPQGCERKFVGRINPVSAPEGSTAGIGVDRRTS